MALCGLAGYAQNRWTKSVLAERESLRSIPTDLEGREASWGELVIGRPSGAAPIELPENWQMEPSGAQAVKQKPLLSESQVEEFDPEAQKELPANDFEYIVPEGRVLSKICEEFYRSGRSPIPERVAEYNGLSSPDSLRAGFLLLLPDWAVLFPDGEPEPR
ncbi:MAG: hypothetical protein ACI8X5_003409 [Planctomycetota bacterium]